MGEVIYDSSASQDDVVNRQHSENGKAALKARYKQVADANTALRFGIFKSSMFSHTNEKLQKYLRKANVTFRNR